MAAVVAEQRRSFAQARHVWRKPWLREAGLLAILPLLVSCVMLWPALLGGRVLASTDLVANESLIGNIPPGVPPPISVNPMLNDPVDQFIPWRLYARSELRAGRFPLWNPYNGLGTHFHANYQSAVLSPFNILWLALPAVWGLGAIFALQWTIMGLGMALLLRRLGLSMPAAMFGSVAGQLMGPMTAWLQCSIGDALVWLPWLLLSVLAWIDTRNFVWPAALSLFVGAELLAGHVETAFYVVAFAAVFGLAALGASDLPFRTKLGMTGSLVVAGVLGIGIAAAQYMPFFGVLTSSRQWVVRSTQDVSAVAAPLSAALTLLSPNGFGWADAYHGPLNWIEASGYVGTLTVLLAGWGVGMWLLSFRRGAPAGSTGRRVLLALSPRKPVFWLLAIAVSASVAYGIPPLSLLRLLPGFNSSINYRLISLVDTGLVVLAVMGLQRLLDWRGKMSPRLWPVVLAPLIAGGLFFLLDGWRIWTVNSQDVPAYTHSWQMWAGALFCAGAVLMLLRLAGLLKPTAFIVLAVGLLAMDMMRADWNFNATSPLATFYPTNSLTDFLASRGRTERVAVEGFYAESNRLMPYRVPDYRNYDPTEDNRYIIFTRIMSPGTYTLGIPDYSIHALLDKPRPTLMSLVGIKWLVTTSNIDPNIWQPQPERGAIYKRQMIRNDFVVWENRYAKPYAYLASRIKLVPGESAARQSMKDLTLESINEVTVETGPGSSFPQDVASASNNQPLTEDEVESMQVVANIPGTINIETNLEKSRFLVINEAWSAGWQATIDGQPATLYRASYLAQGLVVPQGPHKVLLSYDPPEFKVGLGISGVSLLGWTGLLVFAVRRRRKQAASVADAGV